MPNFMFHRIVEHQTAAFLPNPCLSTYAHFTARWNYQTEMAAQDRLCVADMGNNVRTRSQEREPSSGHTGDRLDDLGGSRTTLAVVKQFRAESPQAKNFPSVVVEKLFGPSNHRSLLNSCKLFTYGTPLALQRFGKLEKCGVKVHLRVAVYRMVGVLLGMFIGYQSTQAQTARQSGPEAGQISLLQAVKTALAKNAAVQSAELQVDVGRGRLEQASGSFDFVAQASVNQQRNYTVLTQAQVAQFPPMFDAPNASINELTNTSLGFSRLTRSGVTLETSVAVSRTEDNISRLTAGAEAQSRPSYTIKLTVPLLRNSGRDIAAASESIAKSEVDALRNDLAFSVSQVAFSAVQSYWSVLSAMRTLEIAREAETTAARRGSDVERLIVADRLPAAERDLVTADIAAKRSSRIAAEQGLRESRASLGRIMGLEAAPIFAMPSDDYPVVTPQAHSVLERIEVLQRTALEARADLRSAEIRREAARIALHSAEKSIRPQLDLSMALGMNGLREGNSHNDYFGSLSSGLRGPRFDVALVYQLPVENRSATGQLTQRHAASAQADIQFKDLRNTILTNVDTLAHSVQGLALQLTEAANSVALYERSLANEETRRQLGSSTLIDVINVSDRLLSARLNLNAARANYAVAVAQLRLATGLIAQPVAGADYTISMSTLTQVPD